MRKLSKEEMNILRDSIISNDGELAVNEAVPCMIDMVDCTANDIYDFPPSLDSDAILVIKALLIVKKYGESVNYVISPAEFKRLLGMWVADSDFSQKSIEEAMAMYDAYKNSYESKSSQVVIASLMPLEE